MAQILDPLPKDGTSVILCCYVNATSQIQVSRITNIPNWYFERVVFPGQRLMFEAPPSAQIEIHSGMMASAILSDTIPCERLRIDALEETNSAATCGPTDGIPEDHARAAAKPADREPALASQAQPT
ncbi:MAG: DUF1830 domain-containing protein [Oscillatoriales cyanobacterium]|jgi:Domain of unknown function (DUF1830)|nr:MAG: DUF1830 domain-containing protein [Oscillatoriales cyanobacterium]